MKNITCRLLVICAWGAATLAAPLHATGAEPVTDQQLYAKAEEAWHVSWERFFLEKTHLFYDYVSSYDTGTRFAHLPKPEEANRQYPNPTGWGTGMEDCAISGGVMMSMLCDRFTATGDQSLRPFAQKLFAGLVSLGTVGETEGFVMRGICPSDGRSHYSESSRDQYTWYVYALWRYYHCALAGDDEKATMRNIIAAICKRMERNIVAANDYRIGKDDGKFNTLVDKMWNTDAHEIARLPMIYAIGADLTGDSHWREMAKKYSAEAAAKSSGESTKIPYALLQHQVSLETLYKLEDSPELKRQWLESMRLVAARSQKFLEYCGRYQPTEVGNANLDWRSWGFRKSGPYDVPIRPEVFLKEDRSIRQPAEAALSMLLCPKPALTSEQLAPVKQNIAQVDYTKSVYYSLYYTQAAYWRAVNEGLIHLPAGAK